MIDVMQDAGLVSSSVRTPVDVSQHIMCVTVTMTVEITPMNSTVNTVNITTLTAIKHVVAAETGIERCLEDDSVLFVEKKSGIS